MNAFERLQQAVANAGGTLNERTRSAFGSSIAKVLGGMDANKVLLVATDAACIKFYGTLDEEMRKSVTLFDATREHDQPTEYAKVRAHVLPYLKNRKVKVLAAPYRIGDDLVGFTIRKTQ